MKVLILYFSATGNTKKIADVIGDELGRTGSVEAMKEKKSRIYR